MGCCSSSQDEQRPLLVGEEAEKPKAKPTQATTPSSASSDEPRSRSPERDAAATAAASATNAASSPSSRGGEISSDGAATGNDANNAAGAAEAGAGESDGRGGKGDVSGGGGIMGALQGVGVCGAGASGNDGGNADDGGAAQEALEKIVETTENQFVNAAHSKQHIISGRESEYRSNKYASVVARHTLPASILYDLGLAAPTMTSTGLTQSSLAQILEPKPDAETLNAITRDLEISIRNCGPLVCTLTPSVCDS
ncbi:hypothetical protein Pelo_15042 [Pelomyxa schiedti]|nr:hypothetical protein Pelo_15042 [Pelomyxa schiedti]